MPAQGAYNTAGIVAHNAIDALLRLSDHRTHPLRILLTAFGIVPAGDPGDGEVVVIGRYLAAGRMDQGKAALLLNEMHHLIVDSWSLDVQIEPQIVGFCKTQ